MPMGIGIGLSITLGEGGASYEAEAAALFARFSTPPDGARKSLINALIKSLKTAGVWSKLDALYVMAAADSQAARQNWIADQYNLTPVSSPTFTADRGYAGDGASSYLTTGFTPSTNGVQFQQDSASIGAYVNAGTDTALDAAPAMGSIDGTGGSFLRPRNSSDGIGGRLNQAGSADAGGAVGTRRGLSVLDRSASNLVTAYRNGTSVGTMSNTSVARVAAALAIGAINNNGTPIQFVNNRIAAAFIGASLGEAAEAALATALSTYLTALGAN